MNKIFIFVLISIVVFPSLVFGGSFVSSLIAGKTTDEAIQIIAEQLDIVIGRTNVIENVQIDTTESIATVENKQSDQGVVISKVQVDQSTQDQIISNLQNTINNQNQIISNQQISINQIVQDIANNDIPEEVIPDPFIPPVTLPIDPVPPEVIFSPPVDNVSPVVSLDSFRNKIKNKIYCPDGKISGIFGVEIRYSDVSPSSGIVRPSFFMDGVYFEKVLGGVREDGTGETIMLDTTVLSNGDHTLSVKVLDNAGNIGEDSILFVIEN